MRRNSSLRHERGRWAESLAVQALRDAGLRVLERNVRVGSLELDVIARDGPSLVVVEVRCRSQRAWTGALSSIDRVKRDRITRAAAVLWASRWSRLPGVDRVRFDVVTVEPRSRRVHHVRAAFAATPDAGSPRLY